MTENAYTSYDADLGEWTFFMAGTHLTGITDKSASPLEVAARVAEVADTMIGPYGLTATVVFKVAVTNHRGHVVG